MPLTRTALATSWQALPPNAQGAVYWVAAAFFASASSACLKTLGQELHSFQIILLRSLFSAALMIPLALRHGPEGLWSRRPVVQTVRAGVSLAGVLLFYIALQRIPLADAVTLQFTMPLFQIILAALFLGEMVRRGPALATLAGFAGAVIVTRPGGAAFDIGYLCALAAAFLFTVTQTMMKRLSGVERTETMVLWSAYVSIPLMLLPALEHWRAPSETQWLLIACAAVLGTGSMLCWIAGLRVGEVTVCGPFDYTQILFAGLIGFLLFGEMPDGPTWLGAAVIVASTLYMARREAAAPRSERPR